MVSKYTNVKDPNGSGELTFTLPQNSQYVPLPISLINPTSGFDSNDGTPLKDIPPLPHQRFQGDIKSPVSQQYYGQQSPAGTNLYQDQQQPGYEAQSDSRLHQSSIPTQQQPQRQPQRQPQSQYTVAPQNQEVNHPYRQQVPRNPQAPYQQQQQQHYTVPSNNHQQQIQQQPMHGATLPTAHNNQQLLQQHQQQQQQQHHHHQQQQQQQHQAPIVPPPPHQKQQLANPDRPIYAQNGNQMTGSPQRSQQPTRSFSEGLPSRPHAVPQQLQHPQNPQSMNRHGQQQRRVPSLPPINTQNAVPQRHYQPSPSTQQMPGLSSQQQQHIQGQPPYQQLQQQPHQQQQQQQQQQQLQQPPQQQAQQVQQQQSQSSSQILTREQPPGQQSSKSPNLRQSLNFLRGSRNISQSSFSSDFSEASYNASPTQHANGSNGQYLSGNAGNGKGLEKYHTTNRHQTTSSGRIIPQKIDIHTAGGNGGSDMPKKTRSLTSLTRRVASSTSLRHSADRDKILASPSISSKTIVTTSSRTPYVYPAVLSRVARAFKERIQLGARYKNGLEYRDSFMGSEAVDVIARIIRTSDRNLALLLGRSLDAQKLFHDVTYEHRLRDSSNEVYQFAEEVFDPYNDGQASFNRHGSIASGAEFQDEATSSTTPPTISSPTLMNSTSGSSLVRQNLVGSTSQSGLSNVPQATNESSICGIFTLLTECYSPTCSRDNLCYSIACPRRLEQQARLGMKASGLARSDSHISLSGKDEQKAFWQLTVPKKVLDSIDKREIKRQECIFETIYSERDFVKDLEYLREFWIRPLSETKIIRENEREHFVNTVFYGIDEIWDVNSKFAEALTKRQQEQPIVKEVGDLFLEFIPKFEAFIKYGAGQVMGKYEYDRQKRHNPFFVRFIEDTSNRVESRRLDVSSYLSKPTSRPARYPLLLKSIRDHTDPSSKDYEKLNKAIEMLQKMLTRINHETGKASDRLNLFLLKQKLVFRPGELIDLKLTSENRKLLYQCVLKKRNYQDKEKQGEVQVYLFDHALLFVRIKVINKREVYRVYQRPIPLPLLFVSLSEESQSIKMIKRSASTGSLAGSTTSLLFKDNQMSSSNLQLSSTSAKCPISFTYLGRNGYDLTLYATPAAQKMLIDKLETQTRKMIEDNDVFTLSPLSSKFFDYNNKINCVVPFDGGRKLLYGTDSGIYVSDVKLGENGSRVVSKPLKIISKINIIQVEILGEYQMLLALSDKKLLYWPIDILNGGEASKNAKLSKELMTHVSFFKVGVCSGRMLVCAAKSSSNLIRIFEPIDPINQKKQKKKFSIDHKDVNFNSEPVSISFLKTKLCVGCSKGFEIVSLETNAMEQLLDPADTSLDFAIGKEGLKPLEIDRINSDFLLSYSNFSFFINHNGWRSRSKWIIYWEGLPHAFALWYPYLLAFDNGFIEIRHVETGELIRVIVAENIRFLHSSSQEILYAYEDEKGYDVVASLDFWDKSKKNRSRDNTIDAAPSNISTTGTLNSSNASGSIYKGNGLNTVIESPSVTPTIAQPGNIQEI